MRERTQPVWLIGTVSAVVLMLLMALLLMAAAAPAAAQEREPRFAGRLSEPARARVEAILVAARAEGVPDEPLVDRALEGAAKGASPELIVAAVTRLRGELVTVRRVFGVAAPSAELTAGASALRAGASADDLAQLRVLRTGRSLTVAAGVLADLVSAGVPAVSATEAVLALAAEAEDADYIAFRRNVYRDVAQGASPAAALGVRLVEVGDLAASPQNPTGTRRKQKP